MSPEYFIHSLSLAEVDDYLKGQDRRQRSSWEQTRIIAKVICQCMSGQDLPMPFPWDEDSHSKESSAEDIEKLAARAKAMKKILERESKK